jgi:hypothetical protein
MKHTFLMFRDVAFYDVIYVVSATPDFGISLYSTYKPVYVVAKDHSRRLWLQWF